MFFLLLWYQRFIKNRIKSTGLPVQILGQTYLDAATRIVLLKVGPKVLVLAKSANFCNTLDIIDDLQEVNLLSLSSETTEKDKDFRSLLNDMQEKDLRRGQPASGQQKQQEQQKPPEQQSIRGEVERLKQQLKDFGQKKE
ncbi:MAG: flagellar biosynthetic protein FliO [Planctomycetes bacterium]|nr:flagellar biosynthetic protein FliO [Planctomycetota bacterium]